MLRQLAARAGILEGYLDQQGISRSTTDEARIALLRALRLPAETDGDARELLASIEHSELEAIVSPFRLVRQGESDTVAVRLRLTMSERGGARWSAVVRPSQGESAGAAGMKFEGACSASRDGTAIVKLPLPATIGWYAIDVSVSAGGRERQGTQTLVVAPTRCWAPPDTQSWGVVANLYTVRSAENWGVGDMGDLRQIADATARRGGDFVGVNPLHTTWNRGHEVSPYAPVSRLYRNPLYLRLTDIPELQDSADARAWMARDDVSAALESLRSGPEVPYEAAAMLQQPLLRMLHESFRCIHRDRGTARGEAYRRYLEEMGPSLDDFALFLALDARTAAEEGHPLWFRHWPNGLGVADSAAVSAAREALSEQVDFHRWVQFELDRQLAAAAASASDGGMRIGLYQDLAIGTSGGGSDVWAFDDIFTPGVSIGAPPDSLAPQGQDWGLPPLDPIRLREHGFEYWRLLLRNAFRHTGALRIDHVLGLVRQFWIPHGSDGSGGGYVRFPAEEMLGILALESTRARALVVGEDLGTVPPEVPELLARWGVLHSRVLYFEREADGAFRSRHAFTRDSLTSVNTHDLTPLAGYWRGRDIELRHELGLLTEEAAAPERAARKLDRRQLLGRLESDGSLTSAARDVLEQDAREHEVTGDGGHQAAVPVELVESVHRFLRGTPALLVGLSLDDLAGETDPVNLPGVANEVHASWTRRMKSPLGALLDGPSFDRALG